jgi:hypothetical protein
VNISASIRSLISHPMTAAEIHELMPDVDVKMIRGCIQTMVKVGIADRIGDKKPYQYKVARDLKPQNRGFNTVIVTLSERIRNLLEASGPLVNAQVAEALGEPPKETSRAMFDLKRRGYIHRSDDGLFTFISHPPKRVYLTPAEYTAKIAEEKKKKAARLQAAVSKVAGRGKAITVAAKKPQAHRFSTMKGETVEEYLARGQKIDRSPTIPKFERLTAEDIASSSFRAASTSQIRTARTYLVG